MQITYYCFQSFSQFDVIYGKKLPVSFLPVKLQNFKLWPQKSSTLIKFSKVRYATFLIVKIQIMQICKIHIHEIGTLI